MFQATALITLQCNFVGCIIVILFWTKYRLGKGDVWGTGGHTKRKKGDCSYIKILKGWLIFACLPSAHYNMEGVNLFSFEKHWDWYEREKEKITGNHSYRERGEGDKKERSGGLNSLLCPMASLSRTNRDVLITVVML